MYNLKHNNYNLKPKNSTIYTPSEVSQFIFELLKDKVRSGLILDPCCGTGNLLRPWKESSYQVFGLDNDKKLKSNEYLSCQADFLNLDQYPNQSFEFYLYQQWISQKPNLVLCNPPFNGMAPKLAPEMWLDKIIELFGKEVPIVLFAPMGFRLNGKKNGQRWTKFTSDKYPAISSIISLPRDIFPNTEFHSEILIFNIQGLEPHYFLKNYE